MGANPQRREGYTAIPHSLLEALVGCKCEGRVKDLVLAIMRETYGWSVTKRAITTRRLASLLRVSERRVRALRERALACRMITFDGREYGVQPDYGAWGGAHSAKGMDGDARRRLGGRSRAHNRVLADTAAGVERAEHGPSAGSEHGWPVPPSTPYMDTKQQSKNVSPAASAPVAVPVGQPDIAGAPASVFLDALKPAGPAHAGYRREACFERCLDAFGLDRSALDGPAWSSYAKAMNKLVERFGLEELGAWADRALAAGGRRLGTGAKPQAGIPELVRTEVTAQAQEAAHARARRQARQSDIVGQPLDDLDMMQIASDRERREVVSDGS